MFSFISNKLDHHAFSFFFVDTFITLYLCWTYLSMCFCNLERAHKSTAKTVNKIVFLFSHTPNLILQYVRDWIKNELWFRKAFLILMESLNNSCKSLFTIYRNKWIILKKFLLFTILSKKFYTAILIKGFSENY